MNNVLDEVKAERERQDAKFGDQSGHPDGTGGPAAAMRALFDREHCDDRAVIGLVTWRDILQEEVSEAFAEEDPEKLRTELLQVAAVAVAWAEAIDRRKP